MEKQLTAKQEQGIVNAARQDIGEFAKLYEYYKNRIFRYIRFRVSTMEEAEDLTSQTFLQAIEHFHKYQDHGSRFGAWLYKIAGNLVCDWYRRKKPILLEVEELDKQSNYIAYNNLNKNIDAEIQQKQLIFCINQLKAYEEKNTHRSGNRNNVDPSGSMAKSKTSNSRKTSALANARVGFIANLCGSKLK
ncbi:MAG: sigma-70 family RNA polymerase sigma factor [Candidatus Jacksonbacteria bacterium]